MLNHSHNYLIFAVWYRLHICLKHSVYICLSPSALSDHAEDQAECADAEEGAAAHGDLPRARGHRAVLYHTVCKEQDSCWIQGRVT